MPAARRANSECIQHLKNIHRPAQVPFDQVAKIPWRADNVRQEDRPADGPRHSLWRIEEQQHRDHYEVREAHGERKSLGGVEESALALVVWLTMTVEPAPRSHLNLTDLDCTRNPRIVMAHSCTETSRVKTDRFEHCKSVEPSQSLAGRRGSGEKGGRHRRGHRSTRQCRLHSRARGPSFGGIPRAFILDFAIRSGVVEVLERQKATGDERVKEELRTLIWHHVRVRDRHHEEEVKALDDDIPPPELGL